MEFPGYNRTKSLRDCGHVSWRLEAASRDEFSPSPAERAEGAGGRGLRGGQDAFPARGCHLASRGFIVPTISIIPPRFQSPQIARGSGALQAAGNV